jgi:tetratricopeptide (TPR) repeat protein
MGQVVRCPLTGLPCGKQITIQEKSFFLAEAEKPEEDKKRRMQAVIEAIQDSYEIRSALDEKGINAFTCKICEMIQTCAYGMADISQRNPNVLLELGMMIALGKPTIILSRKGQEEELKLPSDLSAIEIIPFIEYIDIIDQLRKVVQKLPPAVSPSTPIQNLERIQPQLAEELKKMTADIVKEFKQSIDEAELDTVSFREEKKRIPPQLSERLQRLEEKLEDMTRLGFTTDAKTAFLRGNYYYNQGKYNDALAAYNWSLELRPDHPAALYNRGITYSHLERYDEALADFNRSLELKPDNPDALDNRGAVYGQLGRHDEALADLNRSLELKPDDPDALSTRGAIYGRLKRYDEALADFNRSLELKPDNPDALDNRGAAYGNLGRHDEALADFNRSLELKPDDPDILNERGATYGNLGRHDEALADLNRSLELKPDDLDALYNLACLFSLWGKPNDALAYLEKAIGKDKECRELSKTDEDFNNIRDDPRFKKLIESD